METRENTVQPKLAKPPKLKKDGTPDNRRGAQRKHTVDQAFIKKASEMAGNGLTHTQMYNYFNISHGTWFAYFIEFPELKAAVIRARSSTISMVAGKLLELCKKGNLKAIVFFLQMHAQYGIEKYDDNGEEKVNVAPVTPLHVITQGDPQEAARIYQKIMTGS